MCGLSLFLLIWTLIKCEPILLSWTHVRKKEKNKYSLGRKVKVQELEKLKVNFTYWGRNFSLRSLTVRLRKGKFLPRQVKWTWGFFSTPGSFTFIPKDVFSLGFWSSTYYTKIKFSDLVEAQLSYVYWILVWSILKVSRSRLAIFQ